MKKLFATAVVLSGLTFIPAISSANEPATRSQQADDVVSMLGLNADDARVLSTEEANAIRGTGGWGLLGLNINARVNAKLSLPVLSHVKVKANVSANVRVR